MSTLGVCVMKRHEKYYLHDGNICFLVENTMFRLHRYFFERESAYFRDRLGPSTEGDSENGSPDSPYIIHDVKIDEFAKFVYIWYNPTYSYSRQGKDHWLTVLRLATQWQFEGVRDLAIRQLERLELRPVEKIAIYKRFRVSPELLLPSYMTLCRNEKLPSPEEGKELSMDTVLRLASAREQILLAASESGCKSPTMASTPDDVAKAIVVALFELPLQSNDQGAHINGNPLIADPEAGSLKPLKSQNTKKSQDSTQGMGPQTGGSGGGGSTNRNKTNMR